MPKLTLQVRSVETIDKINDDLPTWIEKEVEWPIVPCVREKGWVSATYDTCLAVSEVHHNFANGAIEVEFFAEQKVLKYLLDDPNDYWVDNHKR